MRSLNMMDCKCEHCGKTIVFWWYNGDSGEWLHFGNMDIYCNGTGKRAKPLEGILAVGDELPIGDTWKY